MKCKSEVINRLANGLLQNKKCPGIRSTFSQREPNAIFLQGRLVLLELPELLVLQLLTFLLLS